MCPTVTRLALLSTLLTGCASSFSFDRAPEAAPAIAFAVTSPAPAAEPAAPARARPAPPVPGDSAKDRARAAVAALEARDLNALGALVHPRKGVRFSPYPYVDMKEDVVLGAAALRSAWSDRAARTWGAYDGTGDPIHVAFADYYDRFVYDVDFASARSVTVEEPFAAAPPTGNARDVYPSQTMVEYYLAGSNPALDGMDWKSLRLVFEEEGGQAWLVGIVHGEWTI